MRAWIVPVVWACGAAGLLAGCIEVERSGTPADVVVAPDEGGVADTKADGEDVADVGSDDTGEPDAVVAPDAAPDTGAGCQDDALRCSGHKAVERCDEGAWKVVDNCKVDEVCYQSQCQQLDCGELLTCYDLCGDNGNCKLACKAAAEPGASTKLDSLLTCIFPHAPCKSKADPVAQAACLAEECDTEVNACLYGGVSGPLSCPSMLECMGGCGQARDPDVCFTTCVLGGTPPSQIWAVVVVDCLQKQCTGQDFEECSEARLEPGAQCHPAWLGCQDTSPLP